MLKAVSKYIRYVRHQPKEVKEMHAAIIASILTLVVVFVYVVTKSYAEGSGSEEKAPAQNMPSPFQMVKTEMSDMIEKIRSGNTYKVENK